MKSVVFFISLALLSVGPFYGKEIITLKSDSIDGELIYPGMVKEGPGKEIYAADFRDYYIKVFSPEGIYKRRIGGKGEGPGQMKRMGAFGFAADKKFLFFTEYFNGHRWITFTDLHGNYKKAFNLNIKGNYGMGKTIMLPGNRFIAEIHNFNFNNIKKKSNYFQYYFSKKLVIINHKGEIEKVIRHCSHVYGLSMVATGAAIPIPFQPEFLWIQSENRVIFTDGLSNKLKIFDYEGKEVGEIQTSLPEPQKVTKIDLGNWKKELKESVGYKRQAGAFKISGKVIDLYQESIFDKKPNVSDISLTPDGNILLEGPNHDKEKPINYWLINKQGKSICQVTLKSHGVRVTGNYILFKKIDAEENETVCFIKRENSEKADLLKLERLPASSQ
ncbi:MAG: hypothetical protein GTO45_06420 [Candidatus Aminicenantes bacterium]|nr:hypothetical protein [Candidatus Aminicenantes bacterium]NIM78458.1 hypothetical protein [Candidatus Aminicenantes bacterium]NIN17721.1 hypothetical protein [Candidatus Aminicenantes bacterium]NIN41597.1 hypothetical protein [Candidatus Aminicenantes bacterium]NIN84371.1 hypothetical protein [Candidatus Aminicenantes bacterium]